MGATRFLPNSDGPLRPRRLDCRAPPMERPAAPAAMDEISVFFRDDDMGIYRESLCGLVRLLREEGAPCNYQVVPAHLEAATVKFVLEEKAKAPELVFLNQHGLRHEQTIAGQHCWSEFDGGRPYDEQLRDIAAGHQRLREMFGDAFDGRIFTPPCHKYDERTLRALSELGFEVFSAGVRYDGSSRLYYQVGRLLGRVNFLGKRVSYHGAAIPRTRLVEVSACMNVDMDVDRDGQELQKTADDLWHEWQRCSSRVSIVGVMTHHERYVRPEKFDALRQFVRRLAADPRVRFRSIQEIAARCRRPPLAASA